ncbi:unnamed protein product [Penicillium roqueforti FM164]|uniref:Genomic scaffold, ProqFM164S02 n=1 Tax=Penicillium roqueforti (strain FM164) TaxID=1365484 RepID=W6QCC8_PENRF|nr:unnamed protein product [Penicillium roqueforti FM164]
MRAHRLAHDFPHNRSRSRIPSSSRVRIFSAYPRGQRQHHPRGEIRETCLSGFHERIQHHTHELVPAPAPGPGPGLTGYGTERGRFALRPGLYTGKARHVHLEDPRPA